MYKEGFKNYQINIVFILGVGFSQIVLQLSVVHAASNNSDINPLLSCVYQDKRILPSPVVHFFPREPLLNCLEWLAQRTG